MTVLYILATLGAISHQYSISSTRRGFRNRLLEATDPRDYVGATAPPPSWH